VVNILLKPRDGKAEVATFLTFLKCGQTALGSGVSAKTETEVSRQNANGGPAFSCYLNAVNCGIPANYRQPKDSTFVFLNIRTN
jgi:hypothetical protein